MVLNLFVLVLTVVSFWGIKPVKTLRNINDKYISVEMSVCFKGIFAVVVMLHHLSQRINPVYPYKEFLDMGYLAVAVFFFLSGYGLQKKNITDPLYSKGFLLKRLPAVIIPAIIVAAIFWIKAAMSGIYHSIPSILFSVWTGNTFVPSSWYIVNIVAFYVVFGILMKVFKKSNFLIIGSVVFYIAWVLWCFVTNHGLWWYSATHLLVVGLIWATYEKKLMQFVCKTYFIVTPFIWLAFLLLFGFRNRIIELPIPGIGIIICPITSVIFVVGLFLFSMKFQIGNTAINFLGKISYEIYLIHGFFILIFRGEYINIENDFVYMAAVICTSIIGAFILNKVDEYLLNCYKVVMKKL